MNDVHSLPDACCLLASHELDVQGGESDFRRSHLRATSSRALPWWPRAVSVGKFTQLYPTRTWCQVGDTQNLENTHVHLMSVLRGGAATRKAQLGRPGPFGACGWQLEWAVPRGDSLQTLPSLRAPAAYTLSCDGRSERDGEAARQCQGQTRREKPNAARALLSTSSLKRPWQVRGNFRVAELEPDSGPRSRLRHWHQMD